MQSTQRAYFYRRFPILHLESGDGLPAVASLCGLPRTVHVSVSFSLPHGPSCLPVPVPCAALGSCPPQCAWHGPQWHARFLRDCVGMFHMEGKPLKPGVLLRAPPGDCVFCLDSCASCMRFRCLCYCVSVAEGQLCDPSESTGCVGQQQDTYRGPVTIGPHSSSSLGPKCFLQPLTPRHWWPVK